MENTKNKLVRELKLVHLKRGFEETYMDVADIFMNQLGSRFKPLQVLYQNPSEHIERTIACFTFDSSQVIGGIKYGYVPEFEAYTIDALAVAPEFQKRGIGKTLVREVESLAKQRSINVIRVQADEGVLDFYKKQDYRIVPNSFSKDCLGHPVLWLEKNFL